MSKTEAVERLIQTLRQSVPEISGVIVASLDGLPIAYEGVEPNRAAAMAATALGLSKRILSTTGQGNVEEGTIRGSEGYFIIYQVGDKAVLGVVVPKNINLGLVHLEARDLAKRLEEVL